MQRNPTVAPIPIPIVVFLLRPPPPPSDASDASDDEDVRGEDFGDVGRPVSLGESFSA